jgi:hypothetical protein
MPVVATDPHRQFAVQQVPNRLWTLTCTCRGTGPNDVMRERINTADFVSRCLAMEVVQTPKNAVSGSLPVGTTVRILLYASLMA